MLDITPALEAKIQALLCHRTQNALFLRRSSQEAGRQLSIPEVAQRLESLHRAIPSQAGKPVDMLAEMLAPWTV